MFLIKLVSFSGSSALAPTLRFNRFDQETILLKLHLQVLKGISIVDTPGILSGENTGRGFEYFDDNLVIMFEALVVSVELEL